jgi:hypothetical protein
MYSMLKMYSNCFLKIDRQVDGRKEGRMDGWIDR